MQACIYKSPTNVAQIREINDLFLAASPEPFELCDYLKQIVERGADWLQWELLTMVRDCRKFDETIDYQGLHERGVFTYRDMKIGFQIKYLNQAGVEPFHLHPNAIERRILVLSFLGDA